MWYRSISLVTKGNNYEEFPRHCLALSQHSLTAHDIAKELYGQGDPVVGDSTQRRDGTNGHWLMPDGTSTNKIETHEQSADRILLRMGIPRTREHSSAKDQLMALSNLIRIQTGPDFGYAELRHAPTPAQIGSISYLHKQVRDVDGEFLYEIFDPETGEQIEEGTKPHGLWQHRWDETHGEEISD